MLSAESITQDASAACARSTASRSRSRPGARLGLVGPSGSGKSTLAQILALLLAPDAGAVTIDGERVGAWGVRAPRELRHRVQLVFQAPRLSVDPRLRRRRRDPRAAARPAASPRGDLDDVAPSASGSRPTCSSASRTRSPRASSSAPASPAR